MAFRVSAGLRTWLVVAGLLAAAAGTFMWQSSRNTDPMSAKVIRGPLVVNLTETGSLRPAESLTYRSKVAGREVEIVSLAPEGSQVKEGDLLIRLDTTDLETDLGRATEDMRQAQLDLQVADAERQAADAALASVSNGTGAIDTDEARFNLKVAEQKAARIEQDYQSLAPLLDKGFVTRDELQHAADELDQARGSVELARRRLTVLTEQAVPQERQRAALDVAHRAAQIEVARQHASEASARVAQLRQLIESCSIRAQRPGLVVYEDNMGSTPRRKIRIGDRVTPSQGLVTIPEVTRMLVDTSLREADLYRVKAGQPATITLDAYPDARLTGRVLSVGTVAEAAPDRPNDGKRFSVVVDIDPNRTDLRSEMTATVQIRIADRADALMVPINAVFEEGSHRVVRVVGSRGTETRPVVLGASNDLYVEVLDGLHEGERVRLSDVVPVGPEMNASSEPSSQATLAKTPAAPDR